MKLKIIAAMILALGLLSCGKNGSSTSEGGGDGGQYPYGLHQGMTLPGGEGLLSQVRSSMSLLAANIDWRVSGQMGLMQQFYGATSIAKAYSGPVVARGTLSLPSGYQDQGCSIPPGTYTMSSQAQGIWRMGVFEFPSVIATNGSTTLTLAAAGMIIDPNGDGYPDQMTGRLRIIRVSGVHYGAAQICFVPEFVMF